MRVTEDLMSQPVSIGKQGFFATLRRDRWWVEPFLVAAGLTAFGIYTTISAVALGTHFEVGPYLSPFYEPLLLFEWWKFSPAILILWAPLGFRATCYYYRGAYYKAFFANPPACAVTGYANPKKFAGESRFPWTIMNLHRFFLFFALILNIFLWIGAIRSFWYDGRLGFGLGSIIMVINAWLLMMYSLSCHSIRHLVGGKLDCFSCAGKPRPRYRWWRKISEWNENHRLWAWSSLIWVAWTDIYIRLVATGVLNDPNTWGKLNVIH
jgi:hypothetical protein